MRVTTPVCVRAWWCSISNWVFNVALIDSIICRCAVKALVVTEGGERPSCLVVVASG